MNWKYFNRGDLIMARRRKKEFNNVVFLLVFLSIILSIPKHVWKNMFFGSLIVIELTIIIILVYFWVQRFIIKGKDICTEMKIIDHMKGTDFEIYVRDLYIKLGYKAKTTPIHDFGADIIATKDNVKYCIQAKRYSTIYKVGNKAVQEAFTSINFYNANQGIVITNSNFTNSAIKLADKNDIILIDRKQLQCLIKNASHSTNIKFINES
jgi:restriction system protein